MRVEAGRKAGLPKGCLMYVVEEVSTCIPFVLHIDGIWITSQYRTGRPTERLPIAVIHSFL